MSGLPDPGMLTAAVLIAAGLLAMLRLAVRRRWALLAMQVPLGALLALALLWQPAPAPGQLIVLTQGAGATQIAALRARSPGAHWRRLPGAAAESGVTLSVDLSAALRETAADRVRIVGHGLERRDLALLASRQTRFDPAPWSATAIVALAEQGALTAGQRWRVRGRLQAPYDGLALHLVDPSGRSIARAAPEATGEFELQATSPLAASLDYAIELREGEQVLQRLPYPVQTQAAPSARGLLLAAAPSPETKFLRRWAIDAGLRLDARIGLRPGLALNSGETRPSAAGLADLDLLIVDSRSWRSLGAAQLEIAEAVRHGLGLLLRLETVDDPITLSELRALGLDLAPRGPAPTRVEAASADPPLVPGTALQALPLQVAASAPTVVELNAGLGHAGWTTLGSGRIGASWLLDSYQYVQQGQHAVHASHWSMLWQTLARSRPAAPRWRPAGRAMAGQRIALCGGAGRPSLRDEGGRVLRSVIDPDTGCLGFWPAQPGRWQVIPSEGDGTAHWIDVLPDDAAQTLRIAERRDASRAHAEAFVFRADEQDRPLDPRLLRAALLAAWLLCAGLAWWAERRILLRRAG